MTYKGHRFLTSCVTISNVSSNYFIERLRVTLGKKYLLTNAEHFNLKTFVLAGSLYQSLQAFVQHSHKNTGILSCSPSPFHEFCVSSDGTVMIWWRKRFENDKIPLLFGLVVFETKRFFYIFEFFHNLKPKYHQKIAKFVRYIWQYFSRNNV